MDRMGNVMMCFWTDNNRRLSLIQVHPSKTIVFMCTQQPTTTTTTAEREKESFGMIETSGTLFILSIV